MPHQTRYNKSEKPPLFGGVRLADAWTDPGFPFRLGLSNLRLELICEPKLVFQESIEPFSDFAQLRSRELLQFGLDPLDFAHALYYATYEAHFQRQTRGYSAR